MLQNLATFAAASNPAYDPERNGMTDFSLVNLGLIQTRPHRQETMQQRGNRVF